MDHVSAGDATRNGVHARRHRMRDRARAQHARQAPGSDRYETPEWLDRSFVLPLTKPEASDVPTQPVGRHDDNPVVIPAPTPGAPMTDPAGSLAAVPAPTVPFVRPQSDPIDFARVVRRADLLRLVTRLHWAGTGLAGLALVVYLLVGSTLALSAVIVLAVVALTCFAARLKLSHLPVPRLQR